MKKFFKNAANTIRSTACRTAVAVGVFASDPVGCTKRAMTSSHSGEGYIDTAVKILIAVVLGALLLAGLYALFNDVVMPTLEERITEMFDYAG